MPHEPGHVAGDAGIDPDIVSQVIAGGGGGDEGDQIGRIFVIDDQGTQGRLAWVTTSTGGPAFRLDPSLGGGIVPEREGERVLAFVNPETGEPLMRFEGGTLFDPVLNQLVSIGPTGSAISGASRNLPFPTAGGGAAAGLTFGQRQQLEAESRAFQSEEAEKQRQFGLKRDVAGRAGALTQELVGLREQARNLVSENLGRDVLRGSLQAQGALTIGTTPAQAQENVLRGVAAQPIPEALGPGATLAELTQRERELTQATQGGLPRPGPLGFAGGTEGTGQGMLVGESGPEVVEFTPQGTVRVIPITRKGQGGLGEFDPFEGVGTTDPFARTAPAIGRALEPAFRHLGFDDPGLVPLGRTGGFGQTLTGAFGSFGQGISPQGLSLQPGQAAETFQRLGVRPSLLQAAGTGQFFHLSPEGQVQEIGTLEDVNRLGLSPQDAAVVPLSEIQEMGEFGGERLTEPPPAELSPFAPSPTALRLPLSVDEQGLPDRAGPSILLPAPRQLAGVWRTLDPDTKALFGSAWQLAGMSREQAARELGFFTPRGTASQFATAQLR